MNEEAIFQFYKQSTIPCPESKLRIYEAIIDYAAIEAKFNLSRKLAEKRGLVPGMLNLDRLQKTVLEDSGIAGNLFTLIHILKAHHRILYLSETCLNPGTDVDYSWHTPQQDGISRALRIYNQVQPYFYFQTLIVQFFNSFIILDQLNELFDSPNLFLFNWDRQIAYYQNEAIVLRRLRQLLQTNLLNDARITELRSLLRKNRHFNNSLYNLYPTPPPQQQSALPTFFKPSLISIVERIERHTNFGDFSTLKALITNVENVVSFEIPSSNILDDQALKTFSTTLELRFSLYRKALYEKTGKLKVIATSELESITENLLTYIGTVNSMSPGSTRVLEQLRSAQTNLQASRERIEHLENRLNSESERRETVEMNLQMANDIAMNLTDRLSSHLQGRAVFEQAIRQEFHHLNARLTAQGLLTGLVINRMPIWVSRSVMTLFLSSIIRQQEIAEAAEGGGPAAPVAGGPDVFAPDRVIRAVEALNAAAIDLPSRPTLSASLGHHLPIGSFGRLALNVGVEVKPGVTSPRISLTLKTKIEPYMRDLHAKNQGFHLEFEGKNVYKNTGITLERGWNFNKTSYTFFEILSPMSSGSPLQIGAGFYLEEERSIVPSLLSNLPSPYLVIQGYLPIKRNVVNIPIRLFFNRMTLDSKSISNGVADETIVEEMPEIAVPALSDLDLDTDLDTEVVVSPETELSSIVKKAHYLQDLILASNLSIALGKTIPLGCALAVIIRLQKNAPTKSVTLRAAHIAILALDTRSFIALLVFIKTHILLNQIFKKGYFYKTPIVAYGFRRVDTLSIYIAKKGTSIPLVVRKTVLVALNLISLYRLLSFILSKSSVSTKALQIVGLGLYLLTSQKACEWLIKDEEDDIKGKIDK